MADYLEINDPVEILRLNKKLWAKLKDALPFSETRIIGYPQGSFQGHVRFFESKGSGVFYWGSSISKDGLTAHNYFGHGKPGASEPLYIDVQFNLPLKRFNRKTGGAFLLHTPSNQVVVAHRGIVTLGHGRVKKADLFSALFTTVRAFKAGASTLESLLIGELDSPTIVDDIDDFSTELREAVRGIKAHVGTARGNESRAAKQSSEALSAKLREYFDEFSGKRPTGSRENSIADCYHGRVVREIRDSFIGAGETLKSQAIDLTVILSNALYLIEVKTSSSPQSVYTAIGQLSAHGHSVLDYAQGKDVVKVMVLPELPNNRLRQIVEKKLGIRVLTFNRSGSGKITINRIQEIK